MKLTNYIQMKKEVYLYTANYKVSKKFPNECVFKFPNRAI